MMKAPGRDKIYGNDVESDPAIIDQLSECLFTKCSENLKEEANVPIFKAIVVVAGLGLAAWTVSKLFGCSSDKKMMKAPGRDSKIYRKDFESDPASYFRNLRKK